jgi:osmoprotectant transport system permease protein
MNEIGRFFAAVWACLYWFFARYGLEILQALGQHVFLVFVALLVATAIALPLGIFLARTRWQRLSGTVLGVAGAIQTIPSLALVALVAAAFLALRETGLHIPTVGPVVAIVALVLYALLPILRNTYTGIRQVDPTVIEVARGMGMTPMQILFAVQMPLALPFIMAGLRIASVWTVGVAALGGLIGAGGFGDLIWRGLRTTDIPYILAGALPASALALFMDWLLGRLEHWLQPAGLKSSSQTM